MFQRRHPSFEPREAVAEPDSRDKKSGNLDARQHAPSPVPAAGAIGIWVHHSPVRKTVAPWNVPFTE
jgi:hypothetical protein